MIVGLCSPQPRPQITMSNLPSNRLYDLPPRNCQVRFTLKSPSPIYPSNRLYDLPPPKLPSPIYPQIAKSDLPLKSSVRFTPPPPNFQVQFTLKSPSPIYPPSNRLYDLTPPEIAKSNLPSNCLYDLPGLKNFGGGKSPKTI